MRRIPAALWVLATLLLCHLPAMSAEVKPLPLPHVSIALEGAQTPENLGSSLQIVILLTVLMLALPSSS
jgi:flagellar biosynthesis protein FliP